MHSTLRMKRSTLLSAAAYTAICLLAVTVTPHYAHAAPTVTGKQGCIMSDKGTAGRWDLPSDTNLGTAKFDTCNPTTGSNDWISGDFVSANEVNSAFEQMQNYVDQQAGGNSAKDAEQDARLDGHDQNINNINNNITNINNKNDQQDQVLNDHEERITKNEGDITNINNEITNINNKNDQQDQILNDHEERITKNEGDISDIKDGAVFYNRDADGNKTGGVTFNDGTGEEVKLSNVAAGQAGTDAVNVNQLSSALDGLGGGATVNPDGSVTGPTYNIGGATYNNVGDALAATNKLGVQYVPDANGKPTNTVLLTGDGTGAPVTITNLADGVKDNDAANYGQVKDRVAYDRNEDGSRSNSVTLVGGAQGPVTIKNVASGVKNSDAANTGQVRQAVRDSNAYTDQEVASLRNDNNQRFEALNGEISDTRKEARAGIAGAMAAAGLRFDDRPGKGSIAGGFGGFKGATAFAAGVGYTTEDGRFRLNSGISHSFSDKATGWNAAASWTFN